MRFEIDGHRVPEADTVRAVEEIRFDGYSHVQFTLSHEGFIGEAFNEEGECYKTVTFMFEEFAEVGK